MVDAMGIEWVDAAVCRAVSCRTRFFLHALDAPIRFPHPSVVPGAATSGRRYCTIDSCPDELSPECVATQGGGLRPCVQWPGRRMDWQGNARPEAGACARHCGVQPLANASLRPPLFLCSSKACPARLHAAEGGRDGCVEI